MHIPIGQENTLYINWACLAPIVSDMQYKQVTNFPVFSIPLHHWRIGRLWYWNMNNTNLKENCQYINSLHRKLFCTITSAYFVNLLSYARPLPNTLVMCILYCCSQLIGINGVADTAISKKWQTNIIIHIGRGHMTVTSWLIAWI